MASRERANLTKVGTIVKIREYRDKGLTKKATARRLGLDRKTVAKYWKGPADDPEKPRYQRRPRLTDPYEEYITDRLDEWPELTAERIYREIKKKGYTGSERTVRRYVNGLRKKTYREYKPIETLPGEQAQVDWGHCGKIDVDAYSGPIRPPIPGQIVHPFRLNPSTDSGANNPPIPVQFVQ